jgi:hypothetical protein
MEVDGVGYTKEEANFESQQLANLLISFRPEGPPLMRSQGADPCSIVDLSIGGALDSSFDSSLVSLAWASIVQFLVAWPARKLK